MRQEEIDKSLFCSPLFLASHESSLLRFFDSRSVVNSVSQHVESLLAASAQMLFALRTLQHHGMPACALHTFFQAIVIAQLSNVFPAWCRFASMADQGPLESFLCRSVGLGYHKFNQ